MKWDKAVAKRGGQGKGSCVMKWLNGLPDNSKDVRPEQEPYSIFATMLVYMFMSKGIKITHVFLQIYHTHREADTIHA